MENLTSDSVLVHSSCRSSAPLLAGAVFQGGAAVTLGAHSGVAVAAVAVLVFLAGAGKDRRRCDGHLRPTRGSACLVSTLPSSPTLVDM